MAYTISDVKNDVTGMLGGASIDDIKNFDDLLFRAARTVISEVDPAETKRTAALATGVFDSVYDYAAPSDLKGKKVVDLRPQVSRTRRDNFAQFFTRDFDVRRLRETFQVNDSDAVKTIRLASSGAKTANTLHEMDSLTSNGTIAVSGNASGLATDSTLLVSGGASVSFDLSAGGTQGIIAITDMTAIDLSELDEAGSLFFYLYLPNTSFFTSVVLRWGNDSSNYWSRTLTTPHDGASIRQYWNLFRADWNGATETGTVDPENIDFIQILINYSSATAVSNVRIDKIAAILGLPFEMVYYSKYLFRSSAGVWKERSTDDTDIVNLDTDSYNLYTTQVAYYCAQQRTDEKKEKQFYGELYGEEKSGRVIKLGAYERYRRNNPDETIEPTGIYYEMPNSLYGI